MDTLAIQTAIDFCHRDGGGAVNILPGRYLGGSIVLKSNVVLNLLPGAHILGSRNVSDYPLKYLIYAENAENIGIIGLGTVDGQGEVFWSKEKDLNQDVEWRRGWGEVSAYYRETHPRPEGLICFYQCHRIQLQQVLMKNSARWTLHLLDCSGVSISGINIFAPFYGPNTDGIDIDSSQNVTVSDCQISTGDDAIVVKTTGHNGCKTPVRNITITNCILTTTCNAFKIGTETRNDIEHIIFSNSVVYSADNQPPHARAISGVSIEMVDGANLQNISVSNIMMHNARSPVFVRLGNRGRGQAKAIPGTLSNVQISNIQATGAILPCILSGIEEAWMKGVSVSNISTETVAEYLGDVLPDIVPDLAAEYPEAVMFGRWLPSYGLFCRYIRGLMLHDIDLRLKGQDKRPAKKMICVESLLS